MRLLRENPPFYRNEESEELEYIPAKVYAVKHIYPKYGPCSCNDFLYSGKSEVISAPAPARMIPVLSPERDCSRMLSHRNSATPFLFIGSQKCFPGLMSISPAPLCATGS